MTQFKPKSRRRQRAKAKVLTLDVGDKVLVLLPMEHSKLLLRWKGPFVVVKRVRQNDYLIERDQGLRKVFHINLLKKFVERAAVASLLLSGYAVVAGDSAVPDEDVTKVYMQPVPTVQTESADVVVCKELSLEQSDDVSGIVKKLSHMLTDLPGLAKMQDHMVRMTCEKVVNVK